MNSFEFKDSPWWYRIPLRCRLPPEISPWGLSHGEEWGSLKNLREMWGEEDEPIICLGMSKECDFEAQFGWRRTRIRWKMKKPERLHLGFGFEIFRFWAWFEDLNRWKCSKSDKKWCYRFDLARKARTMKVWGQRMLRLCNNGWNGERATEEWEEKPLNSFICTKTVTRLFKRLRCNF